MISFVTHNLQAVGGYLSQGIQKVRSADYSTIFYTAVKQSCNLVGVTSSYIRANPVYAATGTVIALVASYAFHHFQNKTVFVKPTADEVIEVNQKINVLREAFDIEDSRQFNFLKFKKTNALKERPLSVDNVLSVLHPRLEEITASMVTDGIMLTTIDDIPVLIAKVDVHLVFPDTMNPELHVAHRFPALLYFVQEKDVIDDNLQNKWLAFCSYCGTGIFRDYITDIEQVFEYNNSSDPFHNETISELLKGKTVECTPYDHGFNSTHVIMNVASKHRPIRLVKIPISWDNTR